jgi:hypothetical protein
MSSLISYNKERQRTAAKRARLSVIEALCKSRMAGGE